MDWKKYPHIERLGTDEVEGILNGKVYIYSKLDGTNTGVHRNDEGNVQVNSSKRLLTLDNDNAGACAYVLANEKFKKYLQKHPNHYLYGEYLVKNGIRYYEDDAWNKLYIFDVVEYDGDNTRYLAYEEYVPLLEEFDIEFIPCMIALMNPSEADIMSLKDECTFLTKNVQAGEGLVLKCYDFVNKYGRTVWAKVVRSEFKHKAKLEKSDCVEQRIVDEFCTSAFVEKEYAKFVAENGWNSKFIPQLLGIVWHTFITEECWNIVKKYKSPTIDFRLLNKLVVDKIKDVKSNAF